MTTKNSTKSYGSIKGRNTGLNGCIGTSNRMWNMFPSIYESIRIGESLQTSFSLVLSTLKIKETIIGNKKIVTTVEIIVAIVMAPIFCFF